jgi:hypothetical protein
MYLPNGMYKINGQPFPSTDAGPTRTTVRETWPACRESTGYHVGTGTRTRSHTQLSDANRLRRSWHPCSWV